MKVEEQKIINKPITRPVGAIKDERKIVQVVVSESMAYDGFDECIKKEKSIFALCNDGTLWERGKMRWIKLEDIPKD